MRGQQRISKGGKRADLGGRYFRSMWEANYARYLNWLVGQGAIASWEFEPQTFVFHGVTRGQISYTPDFKVVSADGTYEWHEIKGYMDAPSKAKLKRMAKYYPHERVIVIGAPEYRALSKWRGLIPNWETGDAPARDVDAFAPIAEPLAVNAPTVDAPATQTRARRAKPKKKRAS